MINKSSENQYYTQLNNHIIMTFLFDKRIVMTDLRNNKSSWVKIVNDYFGNISIQASIVNFRNGYYVHNIQPEQLMDDIEQRLNENDCSENDKRILLNMLSSLKKNTNNLIFIGRIK